MVRAAASRKVAVWLALLATSLNAAEAKAPAPPPPMPEFRQLPPFAGVREAAAAVNIDLGGIGLPLARESLRPGDKVTVLVSLSADEKRQQWVIELEAVELTEEEKAEKGPVSVLYTSTGNELRFGGEKAAIAIRMIGPLAAADAKRKAATAPAVKRGRTMADEGYLSLGLVRVPAITARTKQKHIDDPSLPNVDMGLQSKPFPDEVVAKQRPAAQARGVTAADERAMVGSFYALIQFFQIASSTPGLQDVVKSVIDIPWWSIIRSGGRMPDVGIGSLGEMPSLEPAPWGLPAHTAVWSVGYALTLNDKPALHFKLAVTAPRPPLLACAGIVGLAAGRPDGKGPVLTLQVVSARGVEEGAARR